jgi:peptidoglycan/LPS O-acetylase OafA/YrhL
LPCHRGGIGRVFRFVNRSRRMLRAMKRLECLDGLRGVLAVYVVVGHMAPFAPLPRWLADAFSHGGAAVDMFFILSGLVIVGSLEKFAYRPRPFLIARAARIFPAYLVVFAVALAVQPLPRGFEQMPWIAADSLARNIWAEGWPDSWPAEIAAHLTMTHGLFPAGLLPHVWVRFLGSAWSLSTEWQFYALALVLGCCIGPRTDRVGRMTRLLLALAVAGLGWRWFAAEGWQFSRAFLPNKAAYFALGMASWSVVRGGGRPGYGAWGVLATTLLVCAADGPAKLLPPLAWVVCLAAQMRVGAPGLAVLGATLRLPALQWCGAVSYCLYLVNEPVQKVLGVILARLANGDVTFFSLFWIPLSLLLPLIAAAWLHRWVEAPALDWGRRFAVRRAAATASWSLTS